jgi:hypothetical protein
MNYMLKNSKSVQNKQQISLNEILYVACLCSVISCTMSFAIATTHFAGSFVTNGAQDAFAQTTDSSSSISTSDTTAQPESSLAAIASEPPLNQNFDWQGQVSSSPSLLPDRNDTQTAVILIPRSDGGIYTGILTFHSTRPVEPVVWNVVSLTNATAVIPEEFGGTNGEIHSLIDLNTNRTAQVVLSTVQDASTSGSIPFSGDAIELVGEEGSLDEPFIITYSLKGQASAPRIVNDLESISNFNASAVSEE